MPVKKKLIILIASLCIIIFLYTLYLYNAIETQESRGLFGDSFGGLNAIFSGIALLGAIYAVLLQTDELSLQRNELKQQREEFIASRLTNITYKQLERLDHILESSDFQFYVKSNRIDKNGRNALILINRSIGPVLKEITVGVNTGNYDETNPVYRLLFIFHSNLEDFVSLINSVNSGYEMIIKALKNEELDENIQKDILNIYWSNIDKSFLEFCNLFCKLVLPKFDIFQSDLFEKELNSLNIFKDQLLNSYLVNKSELLKL